MNYCDNHSHILSQISYLMMHILLLREAKIGGYIFGSNRSFRMSFRQYEQGNAFFASNEIKKHSDNLSYLCDMLLSIFSAIILGI